MDLYMKKVLRVSVAQICQTIGYNAIQSIPLELLIDNLHKFLQEFARDLHQHVELFNRTEANLDDVAISLNNLNISINDLLDYFYHVQPVGCAIEIPQLPAPKTSNLNFLKPGSKEVLTRPVHIYEHLPPILRDNDEIDEKSNVVIVSASPNSGTTGSNAINYNNEDVDEIVKSTGDQVTDSSDTFNPGIVPGIVAFENPINTKRKFTLDSTVNSAISALTSSATREISSVMMTSGGFISPAIEGRMPEFIIPDIVEKYFGMDAPPPIISTSVAVNPQTSAEKPLPTSSLTPNTSALFQSSIKDEVSSASSLVHKNNQVADRKQIKKVKKKPVNLITTTNMPTSSSSILNDKAQRKRIKMLQKSMAKNSNNAFNGTFKVKNNNGNNASHGSQDKYLKKQYKIKQKQIRHQHFQKKMEAFEAVSIKNQNILPSGKRVPGHIYIPTTDTGDSVKQKKDAFAFSEHIENNPLTSLVETETSTALSTLTSHPPSKGPGHHSSQDNRNDLTPAQLTHPTQDLTSSQSDEIKLNNEPDRSKLNIFKKISSSSRKDRLDLSAVGTSTHSTAPPTTVVPSNTDLAPVSSSNTTIFGDDQVISLPSGTTITPAPPSGSGRHVYAPPPTSKPGDFDSIISVDDDPSIPESSAVLMQRGDLMIHKPKKRGRKPGSKNQPKLLGLTNKKAKKLKKSFFGHHSNANLLEPLNLSHSSIANIANIPLGIASTFPIDSESVLKFKKDRRKSKLGKDANSIRSSVKSPIGKNLVPTKEEFASINQKLMLMDTVLQAAPSTSAMNTSLVSKAIRTNSPSFGIVNSFSIDSNLTVKGKKEKKKVKQNKEDKQTLQQGIHSLLNAPQPNKISSNLGCKRKSPLSYTSPNFPNVPGMGNLPMFPFYTLPARPGLIPSHSLFSQLPNMHSNPLFMPPLMGFRPLNQSVHSTFKPEKEPTPPPIHIGEGNYSKVAPLVPDTMKLELSPAGYPSTSSPSAVKLKTSVITTVTSTKNEQTPLSGQTLTQESNITQSIPPTPGNGLQFNDLRKKFDDVNSPSSSTNNSNVFHNLDVTIEVSSDDSGQGGPQYKSPSLTNRILPPSLVSSSSTFNRQSVLLNDLLPGDDGIGKSPDSSTDRINKEHKKNKKLNKQNKKQSNFAGTSVFENSGTLESSVGVSDDFDEEACVLKGFIAESGKRNDNPAHSSSYASFELSMCTERRRDHKKMKKLLKEGKLKKKKDKKDKNKNKERSEKFLKNDKTEKRKEEKDKTKKLKKEKKKEKQRTDIEATKVKCSSSGEGTASFLDTTSVVPKLTLKLGQSSQSPIPPETSEVRKAGLKSSVSSFICTGGNKLGSSITSAPLREPSPELARISPLVTRPPKQKSAVDEPPVPFSNLSVGNLGSASNASATGQHTTLHQIPSLSASLNIHVDSVIDVDSNSGGSVTSMLPASATILGHGTNTSSDSPNNNLTLSNASTIVVPNETYQSNQNQMIHQHSSSIKHSAAVPLISETNRPSSYIDAEGNRVWICPACGKVDDGSAMIGCDGCDAWYHWVCVGIFVAPNDNEDWFCRVCIAKKRGMHAGDRKRKRSKKKA